MMYLQTALATLLLATAATAQPSSIPSSAPSDAPSASTPLPEELQPKSDYRCGVTEVDARGNCHSTCLTNDDCDKGAYCWGTFSNYCHIKPENHPQCEPNLSENVIRRCGYDEQAARSYCGKECESLNDCGEAESCFPVQTNMCKCFEMQDEERIKEGDGNRQLKGRELQGIYETNAAYFSAAKETLDVYFLKEGGEGGDGPNNGDSGASAIGSMVTLTAGVLSVAALL